MPRAYRTQKGTLWLCRFDLDDSAVQVRTEADTDWRTAVTLEVEDGADVDIVEEHSGALVLTVLHDDAVTLYRSRDNGQTWTAI